MYWILYEIHRHYSISIRSYRNDIYRGRASGTCLRSERRVKELQYQRIKYATRINVGCSTRDPQHY